MLSIQWGRKELSIALNRSFLIWSQNFHVVLIMFSSHAVSISNGKSKTATYIRSSFSESQKIRWLKNKSWEQAKFNFKNNTCTWINENHKFFWSLIRCLIIRKKRNQEYSAPRPPASWRTINVRIESTLAMIAEKFENYINFQS